MTSNRSFEVKMKFSAKSPSKVIRGRETPLIQPYAFVKVPGSKKKVQIKVHKKLFPLLLTGWLRNKTYLKAFMKSKSASIIESFHASGISFELYS